MYPYKVILNGSLEFGTQRSYEAMMANLLKRTELYYKNDTVLKDPSHISEETMTLTFNKFIKTDCVEKTWKNTLFLFRELKTFSVAGELNLWVFDGKGTMCCEETFKPQGDKAATVSYLNGLKCIKQNNEEKAIEFFNKAIDKYPQYTQAYAGRGQACYLLGRYEDALIDFSKSISLNNNAEAYHGRGVVRAAMKEYTDATVDFQAAIDATVGYQSIFWMSRRGKGESHMKLGEWTKAAFEFKFLSKKFFKEEDPNYPYRKQAWQNYGVSCQNSGDMVEANKAFQQAHLIEDCVAVEDAIRSINLDTKSPRQSQVAAN